MKKSNFLLFVIMPFVLGCSQWSGDNPVGVSGGGESGYGKTINTDQMVIVGVWRDTNNANEISYRQYTFNANMTYNYQLIFENIIYDEETGVYEMRGDILLMYSGMHTSEYRIFLSGNQMILESSDDYQLILFRY
jgi:hypothetical protein